MGRSVNFQRKKKRANRKVTWHCFDGSQPVPHEVLPLGAGLPSAAAGVLQLYLHPAQVASAPKLGAAETYCKCSHCRASGKGCLRWWVRKGLREVAGTDRAVWGGRCCGWSGRAVLVFCLPAAAEARAWPWSALPSHAPSFAKKHGAGFSSLGWENLSRGAKKPWANPAATVGLLFCNE